MIMGHPRPPTPIQEDNTTARDIAAKRIKSRNSKIYGHTLLLATRQKSVRKHHFYWSSGRTDLGNYYTKHHPPVHHT